MAEPHMTFRPDRDKLNPHFEGYRLGRRTLTCVTQSFAEDVRIARLKGDDFSYQHVRAFTLCNHLTVDPWDGDSVYWCTSNGAISRARYLESGGIKISTVFECPERLGLVSPSINPSLLFITPHHCLLTTGSSSAVHLLHTPSRAASRAAAASSEGEEFWKLVEDLKLSGEKEEPIAILSAYYSETEHQLNLATMTLHSTAPTTSTEGKEKEPASKPSIAKYNWYCCAVNLHLSSAQPSSRQREGDESLVAKTNLVFSLQSSTVALYGAFASGNLIVLSEADVLPPSQPASSARETGEVGQMETSGFEESTEGAEMTEEDKKFAGLGFAGEVETGKEERMEGERNEEEGEMRVRDREEEEEGRSSEDPQYQWSQTESDVTITVPVPDDVTRRDVHCVIDRRELVIGLSDGTTFLRGWLFAPISPDCSTWTMENHTLEVSLEKEREGEWVSLLSGEGEASGVPQLRGPVEEQLSSEELRELRRGVAEATNDVANQHSLAQGMFYEECDISDEDATFFIFTPTTPDPQRVSLAGRQFLFSSPSLPQTPPLVCLKHDVDAVLWQPEVAPPTCDSPDKPLVGWKHAGTFNALAYVQAARQDKKFTVCPPGMKFAALCDCSHHVFVYLQPQEGVKGNSAVQYVTTLQSQEDILGLGATDHRLVFVLKEHELHVIVVH